MEAEAEMLNRTMAALIVLTVASCAKGTLPDNVKRVTTVDAIPMSAIENTPLPPGDQGVKVGMPDDRDAKGEELVSEPSMEELARMQPKIHAVRVYPEETLQLYSDWSGISAADLKVQNGGKLPMYGDRYYIPLSLAELENFQQRRELYWLGRTRELYQTYKVNIEGKYKVKKKDTLLTISKKRGIPMWFLARINNNIDPGALVVGQALIVPDLEERKSGAEEVATTHVGLSDETVSAALEVIVRPGETVAQFAAWAEIPIDDIKKNNRHIKAFDKLRIGDRIKLPLTSEQQTKFLARREKGAQEEPAKKKQ